MELDHEHRDVVEGVRRAARRVGERVPFAPFAVHLEDGERHVLPRFAVAISASSGRNSEESAPYEFEWLEAV